MDRHQVLEVLLSRFDLQVAGSEVVTFDELASWDAAFAKSLQKLKLLEPAQPARSLACDACSEGHVETVQFIEGTTGKSRAFISCPEFGYVEVELIRLSQWRLQLEGLARLIKDALRWPSTPRAVVAGRLVDLGPWATGGVNARAFVACGLHWFEGQKLLEEAQAATGSGHCLVLVPRFGGGATADRVTVLPLTGNLSWRGKKPNLRLPELGHLSASSDSYRFRRDGDIWLVTFGGQGTHVKHSVGMAHIHALLQRPHRDLSAAELAAGPSSRQGALAESSFRQDASLRVTTGGDAGEVIDIEARDAYLAQYESLKEDIGDAREAGNDERVEEIRKEMDSLAQQLGAGTDRRGRPRRAKSDNERARARVTNAIHTAISRLEVELPSLSEHLRGSIKTGGICSYRPEQELPWAL